MSVPSWETLAELEEAQAAEPGTDFAVRLLRRFLSLCESPRTRSAMLRMVKGSVGSARAGRVLYQAVNRLAVNPVARATGVQAGPDRPVDPGRPARLIKPAVRDERAADIEISLPDRHGRRTHRAGTGSGEPGSTPSGHTAVTR